MVVVPPFELDGRQVRSSEVRELIRTGKLAAAAELLGRPVTLTGTLIDGRLAVHLPMAVPPDGRYDVLVGGEAADAVVRAGWIELPDLVSSGRVSVAFV